MDSNTVSVLQRQVRRIAQFIIDCDITVIIDNARDGQCIESIIVCCGHVATVRRVSWFVSCAGGFVVSRGGATAIRSPAVCSVAVCTAVKTTAMMLPPPLPPSCALSSSFEFLIVAVVFQRTRWIREHHHLCSCRCIVISGQKLLQAQRRIKL